MAEKRKLLTFIGLIFLWQLGACAAVLNPDFEQVDPEDPNRPLHWHSQRSYDSFGDLVEDEFKYAYSATGYIPDPAMQNEEYPLDWQVQGIEPALGRRFGLVNSDGHMEGPIDVRLYQIITVEAGARLSGQFFFGTYDWSPYPDFATILLIPEPDGDREQAIELLHIDIDDVGNAGSMAQWSWFSHTFTHGQEGTYKLEIRVRDYADTLYASLLGVDNISYCPEPLAGDFNRDCVVDFLDLAMLGSYWLEDCTWLQGCLTTDVNADGRVDVDDLVHLSRDWLSDGH